MQPVFPQIPAHQVPLLRMERNPYPVEAELREIKTVLERFSFLHDPLTESVRNWHREFSKFVRSDIYRNQVGRKEFLEKTEAEFVTLMQEILIDPVTFTPLDNQALLGSDGNTYANYHLNIYYSQVDYRYASQSPLAPEANVPFYTEPHPVARFLVDWLVKRHSFPISDRFVELYDQYREIVASGTEPLIPTIENENRRRVIYNQRERIFRREQAAQARARDLQDRVRREYEREVAERVNRAMEGLEARQREFEARERENDERLREIEEANARARQEMEENLAARRAQADNLQRDNDELNAMLQNTELNLSACERENAELQIAINEVRKANEDKKCDWMQTVITIAVCVAVSYAVGATVAPTQGGATVTGTWVF